MVDPIVSALQGITERVRNIESQVSLTPVRYTVSGAGYLITNSQIGETLVELNTVPVWSTTNELILVIDPGTDQCEARRVSTLTGTICNFILPLDYAHSADDAVLFIDFAMLNTSWFGAKGDGVSDDTLALNRAIQQAANISPCELCFTGETYQVTNTLNIPFSTNITFKGIVTKIPHIFGVGTFANLFEAMNGVVDVSFERLKFSGANIDSGIYFLGNCFDLNFYNCIFENFKQNGIFIDATYLNGENLFILNNRFHSISGNAGIYVYGNNQFESITIMGNEFANCKYSTYIDAASKINLSGNISTTALSGWHWYFNSCSYVTVSGNSPNPSTGTYWGGTNQFAVDMDKISVFLPAKMFSATYGTPVFQDSYQLGGAWLFSDVDVEEVGAYIAIPYACRDTLTWYFYIYFAMDSATSGNVVINLAYLDIYDNQDLSTGMISKTDTVPVPTNSKHLKIYRITMTGSTVTARDLMRITFARHGNNGSDDAVGDLVFLGVMLTRPN